jgi:hypothetical protein
MPQSLDFGDIINQAKDLVLFEKNIYLCEDEKFKKPPKKRAALKTYLSFDSRFTWKGFQHLKKKFQASLSQKYRTCFWRFVYCVIKEIKGVWNSLCLKNANERATYQ